jgi:hypothetical protein
MAESTPHDAETIRSLASSLGYFIDSIDGLRQHRGQASGQIFVRGYYRPGDGAEGYFFWDAANTLKDDGGTAIDPSGRGDAGRWVRMTRGVSVTPLWWGAKFDDSTDDTEAIQAAIDFAIATGGSVLLPPGTTKITRTLILTAGGDGHRSGFEFSGRGKFGDSAASMRNGSGTLLKYYGDADSAAAILNVDRSVWRYTTIGNLSVLCVTPFACKFGILFSSTEFSQHNVENVTVDNVRIAFGILLGTGVNGEFTHFSNCGAGAVQAFFYSNSGQAFTQRFDHCGCGLLPGGTYFILDVTGGLSPGGGLIVTDFNATGGKMGDPNPPTNTTLLYAGQSMSPISFFGGRIEHLTRLVDLPPNFLGLTLSFRGMEFTVDCDPTLKTHTTEAFIVAHDNAAVMTVSDCQFEGTKGREILSIDATKCTDYGAAISFSNCMFGGFLAAPKVSGLRHDTMTSIKFINCRASTKFARPLHGGQYGDDRFQPMNFAWGAAEADEAVRSRRLSTSSALAVSGRPGNVLASPGICRFGDAPGPCATPDAPWGLIGAPGNIRVGHAAPSGDGGPAVSPWARSIAIQAGAGLYQDMARTDLSDSAGTTSYFHAPVHELYYQALFPSIAGLGSLRVALENSVTGEVYDESILKAVSERASGPHLVSLLARVPPVALASRFRLKLHNIATADPVMLIMAWQFASPRLDASFVGVEGLAEMADAWALSAESIRAWGRFMLPYKADVLGAAAPGLLPDLYSDQYVSADDGRLTYFAGDVWCKAPRTVYGIAPPGDGNWRVEDQVMNQKPKAGAYVGWICVGAGSPGEWRPFGLIA